ncbi:MAG: DUF2145 domain-containing protein [Pseudomonadota bacterium]
MMKKTFSLCVLLLVLGQHAWAGRPCEALTINAKTLYQAHQIAYQMYQTLESSGAQLALVARAGADLSEYGLKYSHMGLILRDAVPHSSDTGRWRFIHLLNHCGNKSSALYQQGLVNFFLDDLFRMEALLVIPSPELQYRLIAKLMAHQGGAVHQAHYSILANPFAKDYQNSNGWVLEMLAAAQLGDTQPTRSRMQAFLQQQGYQGDSIKISRLKRIGARLFKANVQFDDHPRESFFSMRYEVVTVRSVVHYLQAQNLIQQQISFVMP